MGKHRRYPMAGYLLQVGTNNEDAHRLYRGEDVDGDA
jgi:hypothetical protein